MEKRMLEGQRQTQELWKQCDWDFHHALISACGSDVLLSTHALIYDRYLRYQMIAVVFRGEIAAREHQALLESALNRDWKKAQTIMLSHIRGCVDHALREDHAGIFSGASQATPAKTLAKADDPAAKSKPKSKPPAKKPVGAKRSAGK
jgi:DNA-binding FadR family transcriptional regulator